MSKRIGIAILVLAALIGGGKAWLDSWISARLRQQTQQPSSVRTDFTRAALAWPDTLRIEHVQAHVGLLPPWQARVLTVPHLHRFLLQKNLPHQLSAQAVDAGFAWSAGTDSGVPIWAQALGYGPYYLTAKEADSLGAARLLGPMQAEATYTPHNQQAVATLHWRMADLGDLRISATLDGITEWPSPHWQNHRIVAAKIELRNPDNAAGLRLLAEYLAKRAQQTPQQWGQSLHQKLLADLRLAGITLPDASQQALLQFFTHWDSLAILLEPAQPLHLSALATLAPRQWITALGLRLEN